MQGAAPSPNPFFVIKEQRVDTPKTRAVHRERTEILVERLSRHRFLQNYGARICNVTGRSSLVEPAMVEIAHMQSFKLTYSKEHIKRWEWMVGHRWLNTHHVDSRLNLMYLYVEIHKMLDKHLATFLLGPSILGRVKELLAQNSLVKTVKEPRASIPQVLDMEMPDEGWEVTFMSTRLDPHSSILTNKLVTDDVTKKVHTDKDCKVYSSPFRITLRTATSPIYILANMAEQDAVLRAEDADDSWMNGWTADEIALLDDAVFLMRKYINGAEVPSEFKRQERRANLRSGKTETVTEGSRSPASYDYLHGVWAGWLLQGAPSNPDDCSDDDESDDDESDDDESDDGEERELVLGALHTPDKTVGEKRLWQSSPSVARRGTGFVDRPAAKRARTDR
ncbi:hypothetical protein C8R47DRAFT_1321427 [Mycena vitilis]|nr:hypothetical protein C8R47DRAFT_1321427 [Mycena vitilis]